MLTVFSSPGHNVQGRDATVELGPQMAGTGRPGADRGGPER